VKQRLAQKKSPKCRFALVETKIEKAGCWAGFFVASGIYWQLQPEWPQPWPLRCPLAQVSLQNI
jgi:hypothetical protein